MASIDIADLLTGMAAFLATSWMIVQAIMGYRRQTKKDDADIAGKYGEIADRAADRALGLEERLAAQDKKITAQSARIDNLASCVEKLRRQNKLQRQWIHLTRGQLTKLNVKPIEVEGLDEIDLDCDEKGV